MPVRLLTVGSDPDNTLFGIDSDGTLRWYRYSGGGQSDTAASTSTWLGWDPNSGNPIGKGWGDFSWLGAGIQGTLLGVDGQGNLRRYYYTGAGESDYDGDQNWASQSGTVLATGFGGFKHLALILDEGDYTAGTDDLQILAVEESGDVWVYGYHNGVPRPNTPVLAAHGWTEFDYLIGNPNFGRVFGVGAGGELYWLVVWVVYNTDDTVSIRLSPTSGNPIGFGWDQYVSATAGVDHEVDSKWYIPIYAVDRYHNLHWHGYTGHGAEDPDGVTGWVTPNSGNIISGSW